MTQRNRVEVVQFINNQLENGPQDETKKPFCTHYGYAELRELLDFLYGGPPEQEVEKLINPLPRKIGF